MGGSWCQGSYRGPGRPPLLHPLPSCISFSLTCPSSPLPPFLANSLSSNLGLLAGCRAPLAAARSSWNPEGASCSGIGARGPCHLNLRPTCSKHPPQSSTLEIFVEGEGAAQAHLSDTPCWMWASPLKMVRRWVWRSGGLDQGQNMSKLQSRSVTARASNHLGT